ncbi:MAG: hypothetical protein K9G64_07400 [Bacteroidia bacterium]|nr:hypothetical protein [Bacteroidia bacterium]
MNHLNNQNKFEQKLKEQFDNFEAKPNEALWENITQNIPIDNFEKTVATKLNTLKYEPNENIWLAIEKRLPFIVQVNKKLIYLWTFVVLSFGVFAGIFINKFVNNSKTSGALSHPKAFVWLENNGELAIGNKQLAISHTDLVEGNNKQNENGTVEIENHAIKSNNKSNSILSQNVISEKVKVNNRAKNNRHANSVALTQPTILFNQAIEQNMVNSLPLARAIVLANLPIQKNGNIEPTNSSSVASNIPTNNEISPIISNKPLLEPSKDSVTETVKLDKIDSTITTPKNTAVLAQQVSDENYTGPSLKKEKLTIIAYGGLGYSYMRYAANNHANSATNQKLREQTESTESEITGGFLIGYDLTKRFTISSGLILANFKQAMNFSKEKAKNPNGNYEENMIYYNDSIIVGNSNSATLKYSFTEVPIFITYKALETQKIELAFQTGLGIGFVTGINTYIINTNNIGVYEVTNKDDFPAFKNTLFFSFQPQFTYNLNSPGVSVGLMPIIKTSLTNIVNDENWLKQYPYNMSVNVFLRKRF